MSKAFVMDIKPDDEPLVRRLGAAVVKQWDHLSPNDRGVILEQANFAEDPKAMTANLREQLLSLLREQRV